MIIAQYYQFLRLGFGGYQTIMQNLDNVAARLRQGFIETGEGHMHQTPCALPLIEKHVRFSLLTSTTALRMISDRCSDSLNLRCLKAEDVM